MNDKFKAITVDAVKNENILLFDNIEQGFNNYESLTLSGNQSQYDNFLKKALTLNGESYAFVDFYYGRLAVEEKVKFKEALIHEELELLDLIDWSNGIYFHLTEEILPFLSRITGGEILFSSFYFTKYPCTIWGNYGLKYPAFFPDKKTKLLYEELALSACLVLSSNQVLHQVSS